MYCVFNIIMFEKLSPRFNSVDIKITRLDFDNFTNSTKSDFSNYVATFHNIRFHFCRYPSNRQIIIEWIVV